MLTGVCLPAAAQESPKDPYRSGWFKSLKNAKGHSCCDISDCRQTVAVEQDGTWWATVRGVLRAIPPEVVLTSPLSLDGEAYVCASESMAPEIATIYCFVPPIPGY